MSKQIQDLHRLISTAGHHICIHESSKFDILRDRDQERKSIRLNSFGKYQLVSTPKHSFEFVVQQLGEVSNKSNDWVDFQMIGALHADAVDGLITEDVRLMKRGDKLGFSDRIFSVQEALNYLKRFLYDESFTPPPSVRKVDAYEIDFSAPFFDSFRDDYPKFDEWSRKVKREHRSIWLIDGDESTPYAAVCIIKHESSEDYPAKNLEFQKKVLKICSFKVASNFIGFGYGELLLKSVFEYANSNDFSYCYLTIFDKHVSLIALVQTFGFYRDIINEQFRDVFYIKSFSPNVLDSENLGSLEYNIKFGPHIIHREKGNTFIVPILSGFQKVLFPEVEEQLSTLVGVNEAGNSLRKAYLSNSSIKAIDAGSIILFYSSKVRKSIVAVGVVEKAIQTENPDRIARLVSKRTVYTYNQIEELCRKRKVIAILFRQAIILKQPISLEKLIQNGLLKMAPRSIQSISKEVLNWIH